MAASNLIVRGALFLIVVVFGVQTLMASNQVEGFTEPYQDIDVASPEVGTIANVAVREGQRVEVGQVLAQLDDDVLQASLEIAKAAMASQGRLESALAELNLQSSVLEKLKRLRAQGHASQQEVDRAETQFEIAQARVTTTREDLRVKSLEGERIRQQLRRRQLRSPIQGIVTQIYKDPGEFVAPSDPIVVKVVQLDPLLVVFSVPADKASRIAQQQQVQVRIRSVNKTVDGVVEFVSPTVNAQSGTTRVRVRLPNPDERLPSGSICQLILSKTDTQSSATQAAATQPTATQPTATQPAPTRPVAAPKAEARSAVGDAL